MAQGDSGPVGHVGRARAIRNRARVRAWFAAHLGCSQRECAAALGLSKEATSRHVRAMRAEWRDSDGRHYPAVSLAAPPPRDPG
jgi:hypothetical protein